MAIVNYKKYQVLLNPDSKKVQGLQTGDIIRRQYFDGHNIIYSLMCVLDYGTERVKNTSTGVYDERPYFIGALLEGDELTNNANEILDFARITNLFNVDRSGALYLTASDDQSPFMDVIDGIGRNKSLCWPQNLSTEAFEESTSQYIVRGDGLNKSYEEFSAGNNRVLTVTRMTDVGNGFEGLQQDFYQFVKNPNQVLISYKVRASRPLNDVTMSLGYTDGLNKDAEWTEAIGTDWEYKFHIVTVEFSGRHLRSFKIDMSGLPVGEEMQIADFNIILLSSVANFADASASRVGKLDGITDQVFGQITGYGAYLQKLYASQSAHISGTLTAGDENGFGATFYAGKIHRNCFVNSTDIAFIGDIHIEGDDSKMLNPTGIGNVYRSDAMMEFIAQSNEWLKAHVDKRYCFSCWVYAKRPCQLGISQNGKAVGSIQVSADQTHEWRRIHAHFDILDVEDESPLIVGITPAWQNSVYQTADVSEKNPDEKLFYFVAPQLETGEIVTQYQPTDSELSYTDEYGAWFSRGGIGGTMQNPLLRLNYDGKGSIGTRNKSIELKQDGSGHLANENIKWDEKGKVTFGKGVSLNWGNFDDDAQNEMANRYMRIVGEDTFTLIGQESSAEKSCSPASITLSLEEVGFTSTSSQRQWYVQWNGEYIEITDANASTLTITPDSYLFNNESVVTLKCVITLNDQRTYSDTFTIKKQYVQGYTVNVTSSMGLSFQNGTCQTILTANVMYQGKQVDTAYALEHFVFIWKRYTADGQEHILTPVEGQENVLQLDYELEGNDRYVCELATADYFDYSFPILF